MLQKRQFSWPLSGAIFGNVDGFVHFTGTPYFIGVTLPDSNQCFRQVKRPVVGVGVGVMATISWPWLTRDNLCWWRSSIKNWAQVRHSVGNLELRNPQSNFSLFILLRCFYLLQVGKFVELSDIVTFKIIHFVQT